MQDILYDCPFASDFMNIEVVRVLDSNRLVLWVAEHARNSRIDHPANRAATPMNRT